MNARDHLQAVLSAMSNWVEIGGADARNFLNVSEQEADLQKYCELIRSGVMSVADAKESLELANPSFATMLGGQGRDAHNEGVLVARGGQEALRALAMLAIDIALGCPLDRPSQPGYYTYVSRDTVREIRRILERAGIPWKQQHKELRRK